MLFAHVAKPLKQVFSKMSRYSHETLVSEPIFIKVSGLKACAFLCKKRLQHRYFFVDIAKFLRAAFLQKTCSLYLSEILFEFYLVLFYYCKLHLYKEAGLETQLFASSYI